MCNFFSILCFVLRVYSINKQITQKVLGGFSQNLRNRQIMDQRRVDYILHFGSDLVESEFK